MDRRQGGRAARRRPRLRRGLRLRCARGRPPPRSSGSRPTREAHEHARARYRRPNLRFERALVEDFEGPCDAIVFLQTIEHIDDAGALLEGFAAAAPVAYVSTPNRLTLAPPGAEKSDNPWHLREYTLAEYRELLEPHFSEVEVLGLFHARKLRVHELALRAGWDRVHQALRLTKPFYDRFTPAIAASDFVLHDESERDLDRCPRLRRRLSCLRTTTRRPRVLSPVGGGPRLPTR